jgi:hypothetical protein
MQALVVISLRRISTNQSNNQIFTLQNEVCGSQFGCSLPNNDFNIRKFPMQSILA